MIRYFGPAVAALLTLSGCGSDPDASQPLEVAKGLVAGVKAVPPAQPPLTRALLDQVVTPVMVARLEARGVFAVIAEIEKNGPVETWSTLDDITISLRDGGIVATRGLGADLMAARVPAPSDLVSNGSRHSRVFTHLNGEDQAVRGEFTCITSTIGQETIEIVEISYVVRHFAEDCVGQTGTFRNDFWFGPAQNLRKSRQWVGEELGYLVLEDPKR